MNQIVNNVKLYTIQKKKWSKKKKTLNKPPLPYIKYNRLAIFTSTAAKYKGI